MSSTILIAIQIALTGMVIVFTAIILIWIIISLITFTGSLKNNRHESSDDSILKQKAAAVAVAQAIMEQEKSKIIKYHLPPTAIVSAWQLSMRTNQMKKSGKKE